MTGQVAVEPERTVNGLGERGRQLRGPVLLVGPLPPPMMGPAVETEIIRDTLGRAGVDVVHVDTSDTRPVMANVGALDVTNLLLGVRHVVQTAVRARTARLVYIPISQGRWGYARDALLIASAHALRKPVVVHLHGANLQQFYCDSSRIERWVIRKTLGWSHAAVALTPGLRSTFQGLVAADRVRVLENAVPDPWPAGIDDLRERRRERSVRFEAVNLLFVANDFETKGFRTLIRALAEPGLEGARAKLVGEPPPAIAAEARRLAHELGVADRVEITGARAGGEKWAFFEWADVFAYPTDNDGQPLVVIEAMAAGLPTVTTTAGGVPETVGDTGLTVTPGDAPAFAAALRTLVDDPAERVRLGDAARERYVARYTVEAFAGRAHDLFEDLLGDLDTAAGPVAPR